MLRFASALSAIGELVVAVWFMFITILAMGYLLIDKLLSPIFDEEASS